MSLSNHHQIKHLFRIPHQNSQLLTSSGGFFLHRFLISFFIMGMTATAIVVHWESTWEGTKKCNWFASVRSLVFTACVDRFCVEVMIPMHIKVTRKNEIGEMVSGRDGSYWQRMHEDKPVSCYILLKLKTR